MDPLSLTASIVAIIGLTGNVGAVLEKLYRLRRAPEEVLALLNEISDFRAVLLNLNNLIECLQGEDGNPHYAQWREDLRSSSSQLKMYIEMAKTQLLELEKLVEYQLMDPPRAQGKKPSVPRLRWVRAGQDIKTFQYRLTEIKGKIHMTLSTLTTSQVSQVRLQLLGVEAMLSQVRHQQREMSAVNAKVLRDIQQAVTQRELSSDEHERAPLPHSARIGEPIPPQNTTAPDTSENPQSELLCWRRIINTAPAPYTKLDVLQINTMYTCPLTCNPRCSCICHRRKGVQTPSVLRKIVGALFIGYVGALVRKSKCDEPRCSRPSQRSLRITYYFPMWLISYAIATTISGPQATITALRIRDREEPIFQHARNDNWNQIAELFDKGLASSLDVDQHGWSILQVSCASTSDEFDLTSSSGPLLMARRRQCYHYRTHTVRTPRKTAVVRYLGERNTRTDFIYHLFNFSHCIEELQLSRLQKIILKLIPGDLKYELREPTMSINTRDSQGATGLWWAAYGSDSALVQLLLTYNADTNIPNVRGLAPLHWVYRLSYECLVDLLDHGADPNAINNYDSTPLHSIASYCHDCRFVQVLVANGANVNVRNVKRWTPLHHSAKDENPAMMTCLLEYGAEIDAQSLLGKTPLSIAIENNNHQCLKILLMAGADCSVSRNDDCSILHVAAAYADEVTLGILTSFKISGIDCDMENNSGRTSWDEFLDNHVGHDEGGSPQGLADTFKKLLGTVRQENRKLASTNGDISFPTQNDVHANGSGDGLADSSPPVPGAWVAE